MRPKDLALIALFAALTAILGFCPIIPLPILGVTFALQTLGMLLAGGCIGGRRAAIAMGLVIALVAIGLPVLTGGQGGLGKLIGPTAGFIWSWPVGALIVGVLVELWWTKLSFPKALAACLAGSAAVYPLGQIWLAFSVGMPASTAVWAWVVYLPGDIAKSILAAIVILTVKKAYPLITPRTPKAHP
jgi:biotin transport system substrate-specific component